MRTGTSLLSVLLLTSFGAASAQQPEQQPGAQPDPQPGAQPGAQPGQQPGQQPLPGQAEREGERDRDIAAADRGQTGDFLTGMEQGHIRSQDLEGSDVLDSQGEDIGDIDGLVIDQQNGEVAGLLVNLGGVVGVGSRTVALSWDAVEIMRREEGGVFADQYEVRTQMSQQELENAPEFEEDERDDQVAIGQ